MIHMRHVTHRYGRNIALDDVTWSIDAGVTAILGPNGAGKSTLLSILTETLRPSEGTVSYAREGGAEPENRPSLAFVPQKLDFEGHLTCEDVLMYSLWLHKKNAQSDDQAITAALTQVDMGGMRDTRVRALSGGMVRRLALAQAIVIDPRIIVLDEPTVGLDPAQRATFHKYLAGSIEGRVVVYATHLAEDVASSASQVAVISRGRLLYAGGILNFCAPDPVSPSAITDSYKRRLTPDERN